MAITVGIFAESGQGKTTSLIVNPDGTISLDDLIKGTKDTYRGMDPNSTVVINADRKNLPFPKPETNGWVRDKNVFWESDMSKVKSICTHANKYENIKSIFVDTVNGVNNIAPIYLIAGIS